MTPVTLTAYETLPDFAQRISSMLPLRVQIRKESQKPQTNTPELKARIGYAGTLQGLLDTLAARFNMGWDYNQSNGLVVFSRFKTRLFTLNTPPGKVGFEGTITKQIRQFKKQCQFLGWRRPIRQQLRHGGGNSPKQFQLL